MLKIIRKIEEPTENCYLQLMDGKNTALVLFFLTKPPEIKPLMAEL